MVWEEIAIGFTVAGFVALLVSDAFWKAIFLAKKAAESPLYFPVVLKNALLAPFVAAATFIGSMGNIPPSTVLNSSGVLFAGIMGFIYSDLMVPPLVQINARYYGWRVALYIAVGLAGWLAWLNHSRHRRNKEEAMEMGGGKIKKTAAWIALSILFLGIIIHIVLAVI
jgi:nicotinamide riboside transporter PnuC